MACLGPFCVTFTLPSTCGTTSYRPLPRNFCGSNDALQSSWRILRLPAKSGQTGNSTNLAFKEPLCQQQQGNLYSRVERVAQHNHACDGLGLDRVTLVTISVIIKWKTNEIWIEILYSEGVSLAWEICPKLSPQPSPKAYSSVRTFNEKNLKNCLRKQISALKITRSTSESQVRLLPSCYDSMSRHWTQEVPIKRAGPQIS